MIRMIRCDELGLLVFTEIPGWQHIGNEEWESRAVENIKEMVLQYCNHPFIILWGVRINESVDDELYKRTNKATKESDPYRPTGGVRRYKKSSFLEDVYTYNDFIHRTRINLAMNVKQRLQWKKHFKLIETGAAATVRLFFGLLIHSVKY